MVDCYLFTTYFTVLAILSQSKYRNKEKFSQSAIKQTT